MAVETGPRSCLRPEVAVGGSLGRIWLDPKGSPRILLQIHYIRVLGQRGDFADSVHSRKTDVSFTNCSTWLQHKVAVRHPARVVDKGLGTSRIQVAGRSPKNGLLGETFSLVLNPASQSFGGPAPNTPSTYSGNLSYTVHLAIHLLLVPPENCNPSRPRRFCTGTLSLDCSFFDHHP